MGSRVKVPPAEVDVDEDLVRALLSAQFPDLASRELAHFAEGWDNTLWRLGADLVVRLPRRAAAAGLPSIEARWLPELQARLPLAIPVPLRTGEPAFGYPWRWSVVAFLRGAPSSTVGLLDEAAADALGAFLRALHHPAPPGAPSNPVRGVPLASREELFVARVVELDDRGLARRAEAAWRELAGVRPHAGPPVWVHGDLHPGNLLVDDGRLVGVLDFGDLTAGDPACDLAGCWLAFDERLAGRALGAAGATGPDLLARSRGWALAFGVLLATIEDDDLGLRPAGESALRRLLR